MAKAQYFLIVDTETTITDRVYDFGAVLVNRKGEIVKQCAVVVAESQNDQLFYDKAASDIWGFAGLERRTQNYRKMLEQGSRMVASIAAINRWLERVNAKYNPELTAYNLAFDLSKCRNTGIDLDIFSNRFCLWHMACGHFAKTHKYRRFVLENHLFNSPTKFGNMSYKTNAEVMASFVMGEMLPSEPHTALEDAVHYELPILLAIIKRDKWRDKSKPYNWADYQVKDNYSI
jgi:hypothetical protein